METPTLYVPYNALQCTPQVISYWTAAVLENKVHDRCVLVSVTRAESYFVLRKRTAMPGVDIDGPYRTAADAVKLGGGLLGMFDIAGDVAPPPTPAEAAALTRLQAKFETLLDEAIARPLAGEHAPSAESHRREPQTFNSYPVKVELEDYGPALTRITVAKSHLDESIDNGQKLRTEVAFHDMRRGVEELGCWLRAKGYTV
jgi:hypothetical protein